MRGRHPDDVDADRDVGQSLDQVEGNGIVDAAVDEDAPVAADRTEYCGDGGGGRQRRQEVALLEDDLLVTKEIRGRDLERDFEFIETRRDLGRKERAKDALDVELRDAQSPIDELGEGARPCPPHPGRDLAATAEDGMGVMMDVAAGHAGGHARTHDRPDRGAGDRHRANAEFVERFDDMDVGEAARPPAAERDGEGRIAPSALAGGRLSVHHVNPCRKTRSVRRS